MMSATFNLAGLQAQLGELAADVDQAIRPAAQAGSQVLYESVLRNVPVSAQGHWFHGTSFKKTGKKYWFDSGTLRKSIYQVYSKDNSNQTQARYHISWNPKKAPYGFMVEYGTVKSRPVKFVGRAQAQMPVALQAAETKFMNSLKRFA
jgi:HK97 gp10 family phage protein